MVAAKGNQYHLSLDTPEIRQKAYRSFCAHLAKGRAIKSWSFKDDGYLCCWATLLSYIKKNPQEFDPIQRSVSESDGYSYWEGVTEASAIGENKDANTASLQMIMRNKFGWDAKDKEDSTDKEPNSEAIDQGHENMKLKHQLELQSLEIQQLKERLNAN